MKVSIILPIYNGESTLHQTLDSLVIQSFSDFELIACIDGSTDKSLEILETYRNKFRNLKVLINKRNIGLGSTLNRLVHSAVGEYVAIAEQDDYYYPDRLEKQVNVLNNNDEIGIVSGIAEFWNGSKISFKFPGILVNGNNYPKGKDLFLLNYRNQIKLVNSCMMFRKQMHIENGLYFTKHYPSVGVDWTYILRASMLTDIYGINSVLVRLDRRVDRASITTKKEKMFLASRELIRAMKYEYRHIVSDEDYKFALNTQRLLEVGHLGGISFLLKTIFCWLKYRDNRFIQKLMKRLKKRYES